jgi:hypothetical protein
MKYLSRLFYKKSRVGIFIIGAQKCGTTSLFNYIKKHPKIYGSEPKEVDYFSYDINYSKGDDWYHRHFRQGINLHNSLDASVEYMYIKNSASRLYDYNSNARIIAVLRNPVYRAYSAYNMYRRLSNGEGIVYYKKHLEGQGEFYKKQMLEVLDKKTFLSFEGFLKKEIKKLDSKDDYYEPSFIRRGLYYQQLKQYFDLFDRSNIFIVESEELKKSRNSVMMRIFDWLELDMPKKLSLDGEYLVGDYQGEISLETVELLKNKFLPGNLKLFELIGKEYDW